ncbi:MAG: CHAD domain-containing protein [Pseudomonadota bacterium]|jgi:triphosphatase
MFQRQWSKAQMAAKAAAIETAARPASDNIHDLRVALRRCRAVTTGFRTLLDKAERERVVEPWRRLSKTLGRARSLDVAAEVFVRAPPGVEKNAMAGVRRRWAQAQRKARAAAGVAVQAARADGLFDRAPPTLKSTEGATISDVADAAFAHQRKRFKKTSKGLAKLPAPLRHKARIKAKTWRYVLEMFDSVMDLNHRRRRKRLLADLQVLQDELGALNDLATAPTLASETLAGAPAEQALAAGEAIAQAGGQVDKRLKRACHARRRILRS